MAKEIIIKMSPVNEPPIIKLNGKDIEGGIISLDYKYETTELDSNGYHNFSVKYCDKDSMTNRTVAVNTAGEIIIGQKMNIVYLVGRISINFERMVFLLFRQGNFGTHFLPI